ncbi:MAG: NAD(P)H-dependent oxidoreductase [Clostridia bacterium]|nr:NAD(P)H-dependent oxidoreductase [Clostridia bacterium]
MKLVIHDLTNEEWKKAAPAYEPCTVVSDNGAIRPCTGCFGCWTRDPGHCVVMDGYENMGELITHADEVVIISRYTYGGFSGFVKNVFDRCLGYVLPQFELVSGESHHKRRSAQAKPFSFIFYGGPFSAEEKAAAFRYVTAVCTNIRGFVKSLTFRDGGTLPPAQIAGEAAEMGKILLLNGSMRHVSGNSAALAVQLAKDLRTETETIALCRHLKNLEDLLPAVEAAKAVVLCVPLYVDGLPSQVVRFLELMQREYRGSRKRIYTLANMGLYESRQLESLFEAVRKWCAAMGFAYGGGLGLSAGELVGTLMQHLPFGSWVTLPLARQLYRLAQAIDAGGAVEDIYVEPWMFPRGLYLAIANRNWDRIARKNGLEPKEMYRKL